MSRKLDGIDILKLQSDGNHKEWNFFLTQCLKNLDIEKLAVTRKRLQIGMDKCAKDKTNSDEVIKFFIRLQNSIEKTMKEILRIKRPNPCDDPLKAMDHLDAKGEKNLRDNQLEDYLRKTGF
jgi:hypothetical protein